MQSAKRIIPKRINTLHCLFFVITAVCCGSLQPAFGQDNSPYSRYGIGDLAPGTHIINRAMGGVSAGFSEIYSINFSNPASYSTFYTERELKSKKLNAGRAILDVGMNFEGRTLSAPGKANSFKSNNAMFSYVQIGMPLKQGWGLSFGLRPVSRIGYKVYRNERLTDPNTGQPIDSAQTTFEGTGGAYLPSIGTGITILRKVRKHSQLEKLSIGLNLGYLFGEKDYSTRRALINDSVEYYKANYETQTNFNGVYFTAGLQYLFPVKKNLFITLGAYGNWGQSLDATKDIIRETYIFDQSLGNLRLDSVSDQRDIKGILEMPSNFTFGFLMQKYPDAQKGGWILGADFSQQNWSKYRIYGQSDSVRNKWDLRVGGQLNPAPKRNYFSNVAYRAGFSLGPDYIKVGQKLSLFSATVGLGLPVAFSRQAIYQRTFINLAFEYNKRGNNDNLLRENMYRLSVGFSLSDYWFIKRKYD